MSVVIIALILFLVALVGAPIAMRARALSASYGTAPVSDDSALTV
jgi:hypothetical protein